MILYRPTHGFGITAPATPRLRLAAVVLVAALCGACASDSKSKESEVSLRPGRTNLLVNQFVIDGVESFNLEKVKEGLATREDPGWKSKVPWIGPPRSYFNSLDWEKDLQRIRTFYRSRGYFDVQILQETVDRNFDEGTVELYLKISEGERVRVDSISVEGLSSAESFTPASLTKGLPLKQGEVFTQNRYLKTKSRMKERLRRNGYAYADVEGRAYVYPETKRAKIRYIADPGPQAVFGEIHVKGLETIPEDHVRQVMDFEAGDPYSSKSIQEAQQDIYKLRVFRLVSVLPAHQTEDDAPEAAADAEPTTSGETDSEPGTGSEIMPGDRPTVEVDARQAATGDASGISGLLSAAQQQAEQRIQLTPKVPIVVRLEEARMWNIRAGFGAAVESNRQDLHGKLDISSRNFLGGLRKLNWTNELGYAWAPGLVATGSNEAARHGIILSSNLEFVQPWLRQDDTNFRFEPTLERDVQIGYLLWNPGARLSVDREFFGHLTARLGYRVSYYDFVDIDPNLTQDTPLGQDFEPEFILEYLEQTLTLDYRDKPLDPKSGWVAEVTAQEAGNYIFNGEFDYLKGRASVRGYVPFDLFTKWVLALKWEGGAIYNFETPPADTSETQRVPTISRFYGGGKGSIRSLGRRQLSVYRGKVPVGGLTMAEVSVEPRFRILRNFFGIGDIWGATFLDVGTVLPGQFLVETDANRALQLGTEGPETISRSLVYGAGLGVWWVTPIGPLRFDFAYTLSEFDVRKCPDESLVITGNENCRSVGPGLGPLSGAVNRFNFIVGVGHSF